MAVEEVSIRAYIHRRAIIPNSAATRVEVSIDKAELGVGTALVWEACILACDRQFSTLVKRARRLDSHRWELGSGHT